MVYFDHNATTQLEPIAFMAMQEVYQQPHNSSSIHHYGRKAKSYLEQARRTLLKALGLSDIYQIVFTASGTEANNLALQGMPDHEIIVAATEHHSVLAQQQWVVNVDNNGLLDLEHLAAVLKEVVAQGKKPLVSVMLANNETGVIQNLHPIISMVQNANGIIHSDMCQALGKMPIEDIEVDMLTVSAHKMGGPIGAAALIFKKHLPLVPLLKGGGQEGRYRSGSVNVAAIYAWSALLQDISGLTTKWGQTLALRNSLESQLAAIPQVKIYGEKVMRLPNTSNITMPNVNSETQLIFFDSKGFALSAGSACSSGRVDLPHVQMSMGDTEAIAKTAVRISLGPQNTIEEINTFVRLWIELYERTNQLTNNHQGKNVY